MSMNWYFTSFSKKKFDDFLSDKLDARKQLTDFFYEKAENWEFDSIETLVDHIVENGLTYDNYPSENAGDLELALKLFSNTDSEIDGVSVKELFDVEGETWDPVATGFYEYFDENELPKAFQKMDCWEAFILTPEEIKSVCDSFHPLLKRLETDLEQWEKEKPLPKEPPKPAPLKALLKSLFSKPIEPGKDKETVQWEEKKDWFEWKIDCLKTGFLPAFDSIRTKSKHAFMTWE